MYVDALYIRKATKLLLTKLLLTNGVFHYFFLMLRIMPILSLKKMAQIIP